nr:P4 [Andraeanum bacilliform virus]
MTSMAGISIIPSRRAECLFASIQKHSSYLPLKSPSRRVAKQLQHHAPGPLLPRNL